MLAKQKAPGAFTFVDKCYLSTLLTERGYCLHACRGNVVMHQEALSLPPRKSQGKNHPPWNFAVKFSTASPEAGLWPDTVSLRSHRWEIAALCIFYYCFPMDHNCPVVWWKGCRVLKEHLVFWDKLTAKSGLPPAPFGRRSF